MQISEVTGASVDAKNKFFPEKAFLPLAEGVWMSLWYGRYPNKEYSGHRLGIFLSNYLLFKSRFPSPHVYQCLNLPASKDKSRQVPFCHHHTSYTWSVNPPATSELWPVKILSPVPREQRSATHLDLQHDQETYTKRNWEQVERTNFPDWEIVLWTELQNRWELLWPYLLQIYHWTCLIKNISD